MLSAAIAALIAIFAKIGVENINSELATFIRTLVIISMGQHGARIGVAASLVLAAVASSCTPPDCQHEVKAAYKGLEASGRSYRRERTAPDQTRWEDFEFVPPDRMRLQDPDRHIIRVGKRAWKHDKDAGWSELPSGSAEVEFAHLTDRVGGDVTFECLGPVEFSGKTYAGYRAKLRQPVVMVVPIELTEEQHKQYLARNLQQRPQLWRTALVDQSTGLLAFEIIAPEKQADKPNWVQYTYTYDTDIKIGLPAQ